MLYLLTFSFISGVATVLAPAIWPLLPIILSTTQAKASPYRPVTITIGVLASFVAFTAATSIATQYYHLNPHMFRYVAIAALIFIAICLWFPAINRWVMQKVHLVALFTTSNERSWDNGVVGDLLTGLMLGFVWSPFAAPIMEPLAELVSREQLGWSVLLMNGTYILGIGVPLCLILLGGQRLLKQPLSSHNLARPLQLFFGGTTMATALMLATGLDKTLQHWLAAFWAI